MRTDGFILRENRGIPYYSCRAFENIPWLRHGFSTRWGGAGGSALNLNLTAWDTPERVNENRRRLLSALDLKNADLVSLNQIHSDRVYAVESAAGFTENHEGDGLVTNIENAALVIKTADCFPVLIVDPVRKAIGAVHSGWRGTLAGVLPRAIEEMIRRYHSDPAQLLVAIGPGIRECCFEVGEDVAQFFKGSIEEKTTARPPVGTAAAPGKYLADIAAVLKAQLKQSGVPPENQYDAGMCTRCNTREFFSWRAEGAASGRMMAIIAIGDLRKPRTPRYAP